MRNGKVTRRTFVRATGAALAVPWLVPSAALGNARRAAASERIVMGAIGVGGRGMSDMKSLLGNADVQMVAVSDVQRSRRKQAKAAVDQHYGTSDCDTYIDFRELLARQDIDAVLIATGDNWHTCASIMAAKAGKDIYCEKPMSVVVAEGRALCETMRRYGTIFQCGTQRRSVPRFAFAVQLARSGKLGQLKTLYAEKAPARWFPQGHHEITLPPEPDPPREELDWDLWLGPAPWRPYNHTYVTRQFWMAHRDFAGGALTEWGSHTADLCQWANDADDTTPVEFELAQGTVVAHYANGVKLIFEEGEWPLHVRFVGTEGSVYVDDDGNIETDPPSLLADRRFGKGYPQANHVRNFLDCVKSRRQPVAPAEGAHRANSTCQVANICLQLGRSLRWDPEKERFVGDPMADQKLARAYRAPWRL
ncbi:MAG TPA: Gfo/Idh/MocA family oxidoreductase [Planctomycetes bacterium]|nr:Gfo/Idh/MocA family oxidoreductase [Planctomycetota bacterium]